MYNSTGKVVEPHDFGSFERLIRYGNVKRTYMRTAHHLPDLINRCFSIHAFRRPISSCHQFLRAGCAWLLLFANANDLEMVNTYMWLYALHMH